MLRQEAISFEELAEVRHLLEIHSAVVAVTRATPDNIEGMSSAISRMQTARDAIAFVEADVEFHEELGKASSNRVLAAFLESLRPFLFQGMLAGARLEGTQAVAIQEHSKILDAISNHDEQLVRRLMDAHLQRSYREWHEAGQTGPRS
jgi:DNA-binding FadR family transcriptional regulator